MGCVEVEQCPAAGAGATAGLSWGDKERNSQYKESAHMIAGELGTYSKARNEAIGESNKCTITCEQESGMECSTSRTGARPGEETSAQTGHLL